MTDESSPAPRTPADLAGQLRDMADRLMTGWTTAAGAATRAPSLPGLAALPATASTQQLQAVLDDLAARRAQVQALSTQLETFDQQLGSLEASLRPMLEWTRTWADLEKSMGEFWRLPGSGSAAPGSGG
jgi:ABC-type transporter Mla subunit MlaD